MSTRSNDEMVDNNHRINVHLEIDDDYNLFDTQENNSQNSGGVKSQVPESQALEEKEPWGRLFRKKIMRRRLGMRVIKTVFERDEERDYFGKKMCKLFV